MCAQTCVITCLRPVELLARSVCFATVSYDKLLHLCVLFLKLYLSLQCGHDSPKWAGRCPGCGSWNTMKAIKLGSTADTVQSRNVRPATFAVGAAAPPAGRRASTPVSGASALPSSAAGWLGSAAPAQATAHFTRLRDIRGGLAPRQPTGSGELDRLFNGGLAAGSLTLACGSPGVGKSTLLLQLAALLSGFSDGAGQPYAASFCGRGPTTGNKGRKAGGRAAPAADTGAGGGSSLGGVAYVSGEESAEQIRERARRLGISDMDLWLLNETCVDTILEKLQDVLATSASASSAAANDAADAAAESAAGSGAPAPMSQASGTDGTAAAVAASASSAPQMQGQGQHHSNTQPLRAVIIDSIQTMWTAAFPSNQAGTVTQVRESAVRLLQFAKATGVPVILVGHVTKSGDIAGPRVLEHIVDTVVFMENDESAASTAAAMGGGGYAGGQGHGNGSLMSVSSGGGLGSSSSTSSSSGYRILRALKNRFGSTSEIALLEMTHRGFVEADAARLFLSSDAMAADAASGGDEAALMRGGSRSRSGSAVTAALEGSRALTVELQALVFPSFFAHPRQRAMGFPSDRLTMVLALLGRYPRIKPRYADVLANVVGGLRLSDTGSDLALAVALASCFLGTPPPRRTLFVGELGLSGEVRPVPGLQARLAAARKLGFARAIVPAGSGAGDAPSKGGAGAGSKTAAAAAACSDADAVADASDAPRFVTTPVSTLTQALIAAFGHGELFGSGASSASGGAYASNGGGAFGASVTGGVLAATGPSPNRFIPASASASAPQLARSHRSAIGTAAGSTSASASARSAASATAAADTVAADTAADPLLPPFDSRSDDRLDADDGLGDRMPFAR